MSFSGACATGTAIVGRMLIQNPTLRIQPKNVTELRQERSSKEDAYAILQRDRIQTGLQVVAAIEAGRVEDAAREAALYASLVAAEQRVAP